MEILMTDQTVILQRRLAASIDRVFDAWTNAEYLADVEASTNALAEYAENADDATLAKEMPFFGGNIGVATFLQTVEWHISRHVAQIDYIQTIYGDLENHD